MNARYDHPLNLLGFLAGVTVYPSVAQSLTVINVTKGIENGKGVEVKGFK
jgi:hypothetical protein